MIGRRTFLQTAALSAAASALPPPVLAAVQGGATALPPPIGAAERLQEPAARDAAGGHDLADARRRIDPEARALGEIPDPVAVAHAVCGLAEESRGPGNRFFQPESDAQKRRLSASIRARNRDELAPADLQVDSGEYFRPARVRERDLLELDG